MLALTETVNNILSDRLTDPIQRDFLVTAVMRGFSNLQKKPVPDLQNRITRMQERVAEMAKQVDLGFVNGRLVVKVAGSSEALMTELRRGSDWYEPWEEIDGIVLTAILTEPTK